MSISKKVANLRKQLKMTKGEFGQKLGVTERMVARWENKTSKPTKEQLNKIKEVFNVDLEEEIVKKEDKAVIKKDAIKVSLNNGSSDSLKIVYEPTLTYKVYNNDSEIQASSGTYYGNKVTIKTNVSAKFSATNYSGSIISSTRDNSITLNNNAGGDVSIKTTCGQTKSFEVQPIIN